MVNCRNETRFYGTVIAFLADTLAARDIGGFKVGVGFALRKHDTDKGAFLFTQVILFYSSMNLISH